ncbi:MAG: AraC family transcriptional regulator, partial [Kiritimatiellae bacterium]|nr:AraC family transcriptional regulator [Kiritimatiellia bacterium]
SRYYQDTPVTRGWPFRVRSLGYNNYAPNYSRFPDGQHPVDHRYSWETGRVLRTLTLVNVVSGGGRFRSEPSGELCISGNALLFVFPNMWHAYQPDRATGWHNQWVEVDAEGVLPLLRRSGITPERPLKHFEATPLLSRLFQELLDTSHAEAFGIEQALSAQAHAIFARALALWHSDTAPARQFAVVDRVRQNLVSDNDPALSVAEVSRLAGLSAPRLRVIFREATGLSPKQFQLKARMDRAARLLAESPLAVGEIAEQVGYENIYHFSRQFKRAHGVSPTRYRASLCKLVGFPPSST